MSHIPTHIAIIMDGNGRWAQARNLSRIEGHRKGIDVVEDISIACKDMGVRYLTLYAFSDENWVRPAEEIRTLMQLLVTFLKTKTQKMIDNGIKFISIGDNDRLPEEVQNAISDTEKATAHLDKMMLIVALSYGARNEICRALQRALKSGVKAEELTPEKLVPHLDTAGIPDPDMLIRTSGELRVSNFLLWQIAYTELYFTDIMWPEFSREELKKAIEAYGKRERRFGKTREQL